MSRAHNIQMVGYRKRLEAKNSLGNKCNLYPLLILGQKISVLLKNGAHFNNVSYEGYDCYKNQLLFSWKGKSQIVPVDNIDIKKVNPKGR